MSIQVLSSKEKPHAYRFNETDNWLMFNPIELSKSMDGKIYTSMYDVENLQDLYCFKLDIAKANPVDTLRTIQGVDGRTVDSTRYETRELAAHFIGRTIDGIDSDLAVNALQQYFATREPFWLVDGYEPFKRWLVKAGQVTTVENDENWVLVDVLFTNLNGYSKSIVNTLNWENDKQSYSGIGMNLPLSDFSYTHTNSSFQIYNASDIKVDPLLQHHELTITIKGTGTPTITNKANGTSFTYNNAISGSDTLQLVKVNPYLNDKQVGINSNHGWIELEKGFNQIEITGMSSVTSTFDFAWYFL